MPNLVNPYRFAVASGGDPTVIDTQSDGIVSGAVTSVTFTIPATASAGDIIVVFADTRSQEGTLSMSVGTKIEEVDSTVGSNFSFAAFYYTVTGSDVPGTTTYTVSSDDDFTNFSAIAITVTNVSGYDIGDVASDGSFNTTATAPSITTSGDNAILLIAVGQPNSATYSSGTLTELAEEINGTAGLAAYQSTQPTAGSTGTFNITTSVANYAYGATVALLP